MKYWTKEWARNPDSSQPMPDETEYEAVLALLPPFYSSDFVMHGCVLEEWKQEGNTLSWHFDASDSYSSINALFFRGTEFLECECSPETGKLVWQYDEIYRENDKFVLHILFSDEKDELYYVTLSFDEIEAGYDERKKREEDTVLGMLGRWE